MKVVPIALRSSYPGIPLAHIFGTTRIETVEGVEDEECCPFTQETQGLGLSNTQS